MQNIKNGIFFLIISILIPTTRIFSYPLYGKVILFYKQPKELSSCKPALQNILSRINYSLTEWNIKSSLPDIESLNQYDAIITCFSTPDYDKPYLYASLIEQAVKRGKKVIVLGFLGIERNSNTNKWLDLNTLNKVFSSIGLIYRGYWTNKKDKIKIINLDKNILSPKLLKKGITNYNLYYPLLSPTDYKSYLDIVRKDIPWAKSSYVFSSIYGGYVSPEIFWEYRNYLNLEAFLKNILLPKYKKIHIISILDSSDFAIEMKKQLYYISKYSKIPIDFIDKEEFSYISTNQIFRYTAIILALFDNYDFLTKNKKLLLDYVRRGGILVISYPKGIAPIKNELGILEMREYSDEEIENSYKDMKSHKDKYKKYILTPIFPSDEIFEDDTHTLPEFYFKIKEGTKVILGTKDKRIIDVFSSDIGKGKVIVWAGRGVVLSKRYRGIFLWSILSLVPVAISSAINVGIMEIDDTPCPYWNVVKEPIRGKKMKDTDFYINYLWKYLKDISKKYNIPYSTYMIFNYDGKQEPPFDGKQFLYSDYNASLSLARDIINSGYELGLHGYNHRSLGKEIPHQLREWGYKNWDSDEYMEMALKSAKEYFEHYLGKTYLPFSYVPPMNFIGEDGYKVLKRVFPSIMVVGTYYYANPKYDYETPKEFEWEKEVNIYNIPRLTYGFTLNTGVKMGILDGMSLIGVFIHFFHFDDIFDENRNEGKDWEGLKKDFSTLLSYLHKTFPFLRWKTVKEAFYDFVWYDSLVVSHRIYKDKIVLLSQGGDNRTKYFWIHSIYPLKAGKNTKIIKYYPKYHIYFISLNNNRGELWIK